MTLVCLQISDIPGSLSRTFLSPAHRRAAGRLRRWMASAGMRTWADQMANVHGIVKAAGALGIREGLGPCWVGFRV